MLTGYYGTGKTLLLVNKAIRLAEKGRQVVFLSLLGSLTALASFWKWLLPQCIVNLLQKNYSAGLFDVKMRRDLLRLRYQNIRFLNRSEVMNLLLNTEIPKFVRKESERKFWAENLLIRIISTLIQIYPGPKKYHVTRPAFFI